MKLMSDGWIYDVPPETEFIEVTPMDGERSCVQFFDVEGEKVDRPSGDLVPAPEPWMKRLVSA